MAIGAKTDLMDEAWWLPSPRTGRFGQSTLDQARQRPRTIYVDAAGQRFVNESNSYMEVGKEMYARDKTSQGGSVLADLRRPLPQALRAPALVTGTLPAQAAQERHAEAGLDAEGPRRHVRDRSRRPGRDRRALQRERRARASTPTTGGANPPTTEPWVIRTTRSTRASAPSTRPRSTPCQVVPGDIGTCGGLLTDERRPGRRPDGPGDRRALRHRQRHRHGHGPPLPRARAPASPTPWSSATWPRGTPPRATPHRVDGTQVSDTPSRRTVMAWVGHFRAAVMICVLGRGAPDPPRTRRSRHRARTRPGPV